MNNFIFKIYKGRNKDLVSSTDSILNALRKYFIYSKENSVMEIWRNRRLIGEYNKKSRDIEVIIDDIKNIIHTV